MATITAIDGMLAWHQAARSRPLIAPGITTSVNTASNRPPSCNARAAASPVRQWRTVWPAARSAGTTTDDTSRSSSTNSTRSGMNSAGVAPTACAACTGSLETGSTSDTVVPTPRSLLMLAAPPDWTANARTCGRPSPLPTPTALVVKYGSNTRCSTSASMPPPLSTTSTAR